MSDPVRRLPPTNFVSKDLFPVGTYAKAVPYLRAPFAPNDVNFRAWQWWREGDEGSLTHAICVAYIDARAVIARLNLVMPGLWSEDPPSDRGSGIRTITVGHRGYTSTTTHWGVGEGTGKALDSDALKRAAVHLGVGESLYAVPKIQLDRARLEDGSLGSLLLRDWIDEHGKPSLKLTLAGERYCRDRYRTWLLRTGIKAFGKVIDHGGLVDCAERMETTEPPPYTVKRSQSQRARSRPPAPEPAPAGGAELAEVALATLLATADDLTALRVECDDKMAALGLTPAHRLDELRSAMDKRGLDALLVRLANMPPHDEEGTSAQSGNVRQDTATDQGDAQ